MLFCPNHLEEITQFKLVNLDIGSKLKYLNRDINREVAKVVKSVVKSGSSKEMKLIN